MLNPYPFTSAPAKDFPQDPPFYFSNFGFWKDYNSYQKAARAMAEETGKKAELTENSILLEVGSGLGGSLFVWNRNFGVNNITSINLPGEQSDFAKKNLEDSNLKSVRWIDDDWKHIKNFENESFTQIICLDCIYHFQNKEDFFLEVMRCLKPGGKFVFTDIVFQKEIPRFSIQYKFLEFLTNIALIPKENHNSYDQTVVKVLNSGLKFKELEEWGKFVFPGFSQFAKTQGMALQMFANTLLHFYKKEMLNYYLFSLEKPS